jgi:hypothetical protein
VKLHFGSEKGKVQDEMGALPTQRDSVSIRLKLLETNGRETWANTKIRTDRAPAGPERAIEAARRHLNVDSLHETP